MMGVGSNTSTIATALTSTSAVGQNRPSRAVWAWRLIFLFGLIVVAGVLGFAAFYFLTGSETALSETQFEAIAARALEEARGIAMRKRLGTISMASIASYANPDADTWPFVTILGYETIATNIIQTSSGREMGLCPFVTPEQLQDFEEFAYDFFENTREPEPFPNGTAVSSFGKGVWGVDPKLNTTDNRYHETDGSTYYNSSYKIFTPIIQHNEGPHKALMINLHFQETRGAIIDNLIECSELRAKEWVNSSVARECGSITDMLILTSQEVEPGPGALIMQPIYPARNETVLTGMIASSIVWGEVLENVFASEVSGIDCVLESDTQVYTYHISRGVAELKGEGDLHEDSFCDYRRSIELAGPGIYSNGSASYTLSLYPSAEFTNVYKTRNPMVATVGAILIILFTSVLFFLYDFFVRQEFSAKRHLLEAKRAFVRFVSHEVRTPLNAVCMGLTLLQEEMETATGSSLFETTDKNDTSSGTNAARDLSGEDALTPSRDLCHHLDGVGRSEVQGWWGLTQDILGSAQSAIDVLNDLLNYDKIEMGTLNLELTVIPVWTLVERAAKEFRLAAANKKIDLCVNLCFEDAVFPIDETLKVEALPGEVKRAKLIGDSFRLSQVIRNLVSNAIKFTSETGRVTIEARLSMSTEDTKEDKSSIFLLKSGEKLHCNKLGAMSLSVTDTGAGMSPDQLSRLFRAGVQFNVNELQAGQGSGLGLYISKGIVEQHRGSLSAVSEGLSKGSTFIMEMPLFDVPILDQEEGEKESTAPGQQLKRRESKSLLLRILVVDDADTNRKLLSRLLENRGHQCDQAANGKAAVELVRKSMEEGYYYDTILLDYEMPEMNGPQACKELRRLGCDSFVVGISGNVLPEDVSHFKSCGANAVLPKPFQFSLLEDLWIEYDVSSRNCSA